MTPTVFTSQYYDAVRGQISPEITSVHIPDAYLEELPFVPEAESQVRKQLVAEGIDVDALTGQARDDAILAMIHFCAAELCLTVPQLLRLTTLEVVTEVQSIDWQAKRAYHLSKVSEKLADVIKSATPTQTVQGRKLPFAAVGTQRPDRVV